MYDGGGIMPDVKLEPEKVDRFVYLVYSQGFIDDFADQWSVANRSAEVVPRMFVLSGDDWAKFTGFMADKEVKYTSMSAQSLESLRKSAEAERYLTPELSESLDRIAAAITNDTEANLELYRSELKKLIEDAIILRRHHSRGVSEHDLVDDKVVRQAVELLGNEAKYREILTSQDTEKE